MGGNRRANVECGKHKTLESLSLDRVIFSTGQWDALMAVLQENPRLNKLILKNIQPPEEKVSRSDSFVRMLRHNPRITDFEYDSHTFDDATFQRGQFKGLLALNRFRPRFASLRADETAVPALVARALAFKSSPIVVMALLQTCKATLFGSPRDGGDRKMASRKRPREEMSSAQENE